VDRTLRVTIGGLPGSGTTTACRLLERELPLECVFAGEIFRQMARERSMDLGTFSRWCEDNPEVDRELDDRVLEQLVKGDVIVEARLSGWLARKHDLPAFKVWLTAPVEVRAERVAKRETQDLDLTMKQMQEREFSESKRYRDLYGVDLGDLSFYDLVIDTRDKPPEEVVKRIFSGIEQKRDEL
jgi:CMP/dCMP kinase